MKVTIECKYCKALFDVEYKYRNRIYCSTECYYKYKVTTGRTVIRRCKHCNNEFMVYGCLQDRGCGLYCSRKCAHSAHRAKVNDAYFGNIHSKESAYILGFITADGCVDGVNTLTIVSKDKDVIDFIAREMDYLGNVHTAQPKSPNHSIMYSLVIKSSQLVVDLEQYGVVKRKSWADIKFPENIPKELLPYYILGFFDGDGSVSVYGPVKYNKKYIRFSFTGNSYCFMDALRGALNDFGINASIMRDRNTYSIRFHGVNNARLFYDLAHKSFTGGMARKRKIVEQWISQNE